jgi:hypothetical protein
MLIWPPAPRRWQTNSNKHPTYGGARARAREVGCSCEVWFLHDDHPVEIDVLGTFDRFMACMPSS